MKEGKGNGDMGKEVEGRDIVEGEMEELREEEEVEMLGEIIGERTRRG